LELWNTHMNAVCTAGHVFEYPLGASTFPKTTIVVQPPVLHIDTASYADIESFLEVVYRWKAVHQYKIVLLYGDEQMVDRIWKLRCGSPDLYWLLVYPGEFHFCFNLTHGIFRLFPNLLMDIATFMGRDKIKVDFLSRYFHKQEDFFLLVCEAIQRWLKSIANIPDKSPAEIMKDCEKNEKVSELLYFYYHFATFYIHLRQEIRRGNTSYVTFAWGYSWPLFHATNKNLYARLSLLAIYIDKFAHPIIKEVLQNRMANLKGVPGHCMGTDMVTEKVCKGDEVTGLWKESAREILFTEGTRFPPEQITFPRKLGCLEIRVCIY
jgi:hypothetical protein